MIPTDVMEAVTHYLAANRDNGQDAKVIANNCLPWLDQRQITGEWLESMKCRPTHWPSGTTDWDWPCDDYRVTVRVWTHTVPDLILANNRDAGNFQCEVTTRGQLLMLLTALGVTCKT